MDKRQLSDVIETAIRREEEAYDFYMDLHGRFDDAQVQEALAWIAGEEKKHKAFLVDYRDGRLGPDALQLRHAVDYKVAEYLDEPEVSDHMARHEVFLVAAHREKRAHDFYSALADHHPDGEVAGMLRRMASEEMRHKEKMEYLYANAAFPQTDGG
ncbi:MAG: ferritin family protein [Desulfobacterales bacterium]|nr:ferritin family protein [Desulfobacterales bacterium]